MKKKLWLLLLCLGLVLFIPIPTGVYKDGGTREFTSLTYKVVKYNHLTDGGVYNKLKIYPFPLNFFSIDSLLAKEEKNFPKNNNSSNADISLDIETSSEIYNNLLEYEVQYIRTTALCKGVPYPMHSLIESVSDLNEYYENDKNEFDLREFKEAISVYDDSFFEKYKLVMVVLEESSGSIRHKATTKEVDGKLEVYIEKIVPETGTCDMAQWIVLIPTETNVKYGTDINVYIKDKPALWQGSDSVTVKFDNHKLGIEKSHSFSGEKATRLISILKSLHYNEPLCKCLPEYRVITANGTYGVKIDSEGYARINGAQAELSGENYKKVKEILTWAIQNTEDISKNQTSVKPKP